MKQGSIVKVVLPQADGRLKARPALVLKRLNDLDVLVCGISSKVHRKQQGIDLLLRPEDSAFAATGLRFTALIRVGFLATIPLSSIEGAIGHVAEEVLDEALANLCHLICRK
ncbi:MAG: type II toxin-antitoxin system PemK/MazF family toxin [Flavobacteriales bacterium]|nr:type II toxin-antitoxin system PemK/MazF family toxin [Flavobacteriales bacterium]